MSAVKVKALPYYDLDKVTERASGHWLEIYEVLASDQLGEIISKPTKHHTCPLHGTGKKSGKGDGFRFFKDVVETGGAICNTCGSYPGGISLLQALKKWEFRETLGHVAEFLGVEPEPSYRNVRQDVVKPTKTVSLAVVPGQPKEAHSDVAFIGPLPGPIPAEVVSPEPEASKYLPTAERMAEISALQEQLSKRAAQDSTESRGNILRVWRESVPLNNGIPNPLFKYLKRRAVLLGLGVLLEGDNIRFHRELPYYEENDDGGLSLIGNFPAMIAAIRDLDGKIITLHRTYLTNRGTKAKVECPRKMMPVPGDVTVTGSAIQLGGHPENGVLGVAEGFETAASPLKVYGIPTWSCVSGSILGFFDPPEGVHTLIGWEDKDHSLAGEVAMTALKDRMAEKGVRFIRVPIRRKIPSGHKSIDWNDVLVKEGMLGMPAYHQLMKVIGGD